jgi:hypothetical protein
MLFINILIKKTKRIIHFISAIKINFTNVIKEALTFVVYRDLPILDTSYEQNLTTEYTFQFKKAFVSLRNKEV